MNYTELKDLCEERKILIKDILKEVGMSNPGLKDALNKDTLQIKKLISLCKVLQMSPNDFVRWKEKPSQNYTVTQVGMLNNQNAGTVGVELLQKQLEEKDRQLTAKDTQIERLLNLLNNK